MTVGGRLTDLVIFTCLSCLVSLAEHLHSQQFFCFNICSPSFVCLSTLHAHRSSAACRACPVHTVLGFCIFAASLHSSVVSACFHWLINLLQMSAVCHDMSIGCPWRKPQPGSVIHIWHCSLSLFCFVLGLRNSGTTFWWLVWMRCGGLTCLNCLLISSWKVSLQLIFTASHKCVLWKLLALRFSPCPFHYMAFAKTPMKTSLKIDL